MDLRQTFKVYEAVYHNAILEIVYIKLSASAIWSAKNRRSEPSRDRRRRLRRGLASDRHGSPKGEPTRGGRALLTLAGAGIGAMGRGRDRPAILETSVSGIRLERAKGIEPSYEAWEASVLPLNYARSALLTHWQERRDSNPQPPVLETGALPIELHSYRALFCRIARADASVRRRAPRAVSATSGGLAAEGSNGRRATLGLAKLPIDPPATPGCRRRKELTATPCRTGERGRPVPRTRPWRWSSRWDSRGTSSTRPRSAASPTA